jgi:hypothetical protein
VLKFPTYFMCSRPSKTRIGWVKVQIRPLNYTNKIYWQNLLIK